MSGAPGPATRAESRRPAGPRRWAWVLGLVGVLLVGATAVVLHSPWMSVREIEILGATHADVAGAWPEPGWERGRS